MIIIRRPNNQCDPPWKEPRASQRSLLLARFFTPPHSPPRRLPIISVSLASSYQSVIDGQSLRLAIVDTQNCEHRDPLLDYLGNDLFPGEICWYFERYGFGLFYWFIVCVTFQRDFRAFFSRRKLCCPELG